MQVAAAHTWTLEPLLGTSPPRTVEDIRQHLSQLSSQLGFDHFSYVGGRAFNPKTGGHAIWTRQPLIINTFPTEFLELYHREDLSRIDPVVGETMRRKLPFVWDAENYYGTEDGAAHDFFLLSHDFRVMRGLTIPVYGPTGDFAMFSYISLSDPEHFRRLIATHGHQLHLASIYAHQMASQVAETDTPEIELKPREVEILHWTAAGKTSAETALILGISEKTVQFHLYKAMAKLGVYSKAAAAAKAVLLGLIQP